MRTGFRYLLVSGESEGVVCEYCDGQYIAADIYRVEDGTRKISCSVILGSRQFTGRVPLKCTFWNSQTRADELLVSALARIDWDLSCVGQDTYRMHIVCLLLCGAEKTGFFPMVTTFISPHPPMPGFAVSPKRIPAHGQCSHP